MQPILSTPRLILEEFSLADAEFVVELLNEPLWLRYIGDRGVRTMQDAVRYLELGPLASYAKNGFGLWVVRLKTDRTRIGTCGLIKREFLPDIDVGFALLARHAGHGYATEAAEACVKFGWQLGLSRIVGITDPANCASIHVLEKIGLRFEGSVDLPGYDAPSNLYAISAPSQKSPPTTVSSQAD